MAILPAWVANQNTEFALSSRAMESAIQFIYRACTVITSVLPKSKKKKIQHYSPRVVDSPGFK